MRAPTTRANTARRGTAKAAPPKFVVPQLCLLQAQAPGGKGWIHEPKLDGYRMAARISGGHVHLLTRTGLDWTEKYPGAVSSLKKIKVKSAYIDGELCSMDAQGRPSFALTQHAHNGDRDVQLVYFAFDLLFLNGQATAFLPLAERKALLQPLLEGLDGIRFNEHTNGDGEAFRREACAMGLEGIVSKRADAPYMPDNRGTWVKSKCLRRQEFVIVGWTDPDGSRVALGALLLAYYDAAGLLIYAGRVGTGFSDKLLAELLKTLKPLEIDGMPLAAPPPKKSRGKPLRPATTHWVKPKLVAEVSYLTWADDGLLRHTVFIGLRSDKPAREVRREKAE